MNEPTLRIAAATPPPAEAPDWASLAGRFEREATALEPGPAAAQLLFEAARIFEERLGDPPGALALHRRALALDPGFLPNLTSCRRLAMDLGDDALAADILAAEVRSTPDPAAQAELLLLRGRLLAGIGREAEAREVLAGAARSEQGGFAAAEEAARLAAAAGDRAALAEAYVRCARASSDGLLSAHFLSAASALFEEGLGDPERAAALALEAFALQPEDALLRGAARRHAERLRRTDALAEILRAEARAETGRAAADAWQALAHLEERLGHPENAIAALEYGRAAAPGQPRLLSELARLREARGAWADASETLEALAAAHLAHDDPGHVQEAIQAKLHRAELEESRLGRLHVAIECCREVVDLDPGNRRALSALGRLCARRGDWEGLIDAYGAEANATGDAREKAQRTFKAAQVLEEKLGRVDEAMAGYREALALDPDLLPARMALERLCEEEGQWEALCELLEGDLPELAGVAEQVAHLFRIARIREERLADPAGAAAVYERILAVDASNRVAMVALEAVLQRLGRTEELAALLGRVAGATRDARRKVAVLQRRAELLEEHLEDPEDARAAWEEVRSAAPTHLPALRALGRLHARAGRWKDLAAMFRAEADALADPRAAADLVHRTGEILEARLGQIDDALAAYREAVMLAPAHAPALQALVRLYRARGDDESLVEILRAEALSRTDPDERAACLVEAARHAEGALGDPARAIESYEEALRIVPSFAPARRALDRLYAETGRTDALATLRRAGADEGAGDRAERLLTLARLEADRMDDPAAALRATEDLLEAAPGHPAGALLELRLAPDPARRAHARETLAGVAHGPEARAALLAAAALELRPAARRREALAQAAALAPGSAALAPEEERRLRASGDFAALGRFCAAQAEGAADPASRASWSVRAGEAWERAGDAEYALAAFEAALEAAPTSLPALRGARAILERRGDWAAVRRTLQAEGASLHDRHEAAAAFLAAATIAERRLADEAGAVADYRMAAQRAPFEAEPLRRLEALLGTRGAPVVAALHEARALAEADAGRAAESWLAAARAALAGKDGRAAALAALDRALEARPELVGALELRARLRAEAGRPADALVDLESCIALVGEAPARLAAHLSAAALCEEGLRDLPRALSHLLAALALAPENPETLTRLARAHAAAGRPAEAAAVLRRLVDVPGLKRAAVAEHLLALADAQERMDDAIGAIVSLRRALAIEASSETALRRLIALEERRGETDARVAAFETAAANARDPALRVEGYVGAARLLAEQPRTREQAARHLRAALGIAPERTDARAALAELLEQLSPQDAIAEHRKLIAVEPLRVASWTALFRYFERTRAHDRAYVAATVLRWLEAPVPAPGAEQLLLEGTSQSLAPPGPLSEEDLALLRAPGDDGPLAAVMEAAGDAIVAAIAPPAGRHGPPLQDHPLRPPLAEAAKAFGAPAWELHAGEAGRVEVAPALPYAVCVGPDIARRTTPREQRFLVGRAALRLRSRSCLADLVPAETLAEWVGAAMRAAGAGVPPRGWRDDEKLQRVGKALGRRARRALQAAARELDHAPTAREIAAWSAAATATADRGGLVLCGDVPAALMALLRGGSPRAPEGAAAPAATAARRDALALLAFAASEEHFLLRQRLRVAIA